MRPTLKSGGCSSTRFIMGSADRRQDSQRNAPKNDKPNADKNVSGRISAAQNGQGADSTLIGASDAFAALLEMIQSIAHRRCCVTITGETGTGKEMVARKIHEHSDRSNNPFVPVDCTTLTGQLFESQLFGHVKGAFTGAIHDTLGFFRAADRGYDISG